MYCGWRRSPAMGCGARGSLAEGARQLRAQQRRLNAGSTQRVKITGGASGNCRGAKACPGRERASLVLVVVLSAAKVAK